MSKILDELIAKGVSGETILAVAQLIADAAITQRYRASARDRMRVVRERSRTSQNTAVTSTIQKERTFLPDLEKASKKEKVYSVPFESFWREYPKRNGTNSKKDAAAQFDLAIKRGTDPDMLTSAARTYGERLGEKAGTEYVMQTERWLKKRLYEQYGEQETDVDPELAQQRREHQERRRQYQQRMEGNGHAKETQVRRDTGVDDKSPGNITQLRSEGGILRR